MGTLVGATLYLRDTTEFRVKPAITTTPTTTHTRTAVSKLLVAKMDSEVDWGASEAEVEESRPSENRPPGALSFAGCGEEQFEPRENSQKLGWSSGRHRTWIQRRRFWKWRSPGPQELHPGKLEAEDVPAPAGSLTEPAAGAKVEEAAAATSEAVPGAECDGGRGRPGESNRGLGTPWASFAEAADESSRTAQAQVGGCKSSAAASTKGFGRALGEQEAVQDAGEEEAGAEGSTEGLEEPSAGGRDRARVASPGQPDVQYEEEEKSAEFSDAWWIASDRDVLPKFSLFEHELRSHVPFSSSCEVCVRARGLKKARHRTEVHQNEVQLDQFWHGSLRFLILVHSKSFAIGCVSGDGPREAIVAGMSQWLMHFGLEQQRLLVYLRC